MNLNCYICIINFTFLLLIYVVLVHTFSINRAILFKYICLFHRTFLHVINIFYYIYIFSQCAFFGIVEQHLKLLYKYKCIHLYMNVCMCECIYVIYMYFSQCV